jgi:hypothetical protein
MKKIKVTLGEKRRSSNNTVTSKSDVTNAADNFDLFPNIYKEMKQMPSVKDRSASLKLRKKCIELIYEGTRFFLIQDISTLKNDK